MSIGNFGILSVVVDCGASTAYSLQPPVEAWNNYQKYHILSKIILTLPNFRDSLFGQVENNYVWKNITKTHSFTKLCLKYFIFTKLSHIVCLINVHILVCWISKCDAVDERLSDLMLFCLLLVLSTLSLIFVKYLKFKYFFFIFEWLRQNRNNYCTKVLISVNLLSLSSYSYEPKS